MEYFRYKIKIVKGKIPCKSGLFYKTIVISNINKVRYQNGFVVPVAFKPAINNEGLTLQYDKYETIYI